MASEQTLFDKAASNLRNAKLVFDNMGDDDAQLNFVGYHLQQSMELILKFLLELNGVVYPRTHDIDQLIRLAHENDVDLMLSDYLEEHAEMFSQWESKARYVIGYSIERNKVEKALEAVGDYLCAIAEQQITEIGEA